MVAAYVALGSNLDGPLDHVTRAFDALANMAHTELTRRSPLYRTAPVGPPGQPHYINAVARLTTALRPDELLATLQTIENQHGRVRAERWGPRTLDLDLLLHGDSISNDTELTLPHPRMHERLFVLKPLLDIAPTLAIPGHGTIAMLIERCPPLRIQRLDNVALEK